MFLSFVLTCPCCEEQLCFFSWSVFIALIVSVRMKRSNSVHIQKPNRSFSHYGKLEHFKSCLSGSGFPVKLKWLELCRNKNHSLSSPICFIVPVTCVSYMNRIEGPAEYTYFFKIKFSASSPTSSSSCCLSTRSRSFANHALGCLILRESNNLSYWFFSCREALQVCQAHSKSW